MPVHAADTINEPLLHALIDLCNRHGLDPMTVTRTLVYAAASVGAQAYDHLEPGAMTWNTFRRMMSETVREDLRSVRDILRQEGGTRTCRARPRPDGDQENC